MFSSWGPANKTDIKQIHKGENEQTFANTGSVWGTTSRRAEGVSKTWADLASSERTIHFWRSDKIAHQS